MYKSNSLLSERSIKSILLIPKTLLFAISSFNSCNSLPSATSSKFVVFGAFINTLTYLLQPNISPLDISIYMIKIVFGAIVKEGEV